MRDRISIGFQFLILRPQPLIEPFQFRFGSLPCRDIHHRTEHHQSFRGIDGIEADFHGKLTPVLAAGEEIPSDSHRSGRRVVKESGSVLGMFLLKTFWNQAIDGLSYQFIL